MMDIPENNKDDQNMPIPLYVDYPDVPVTTWLKDGCFAMMRACSGDMAVLCRCFVLFCTIAAYVIITVNCYDDVPAFRALLATFVLTGADLLPKISHEQHEDIIEWGFASFLLVLGLLAAREQWFSEDVSMGIITGSAASLYKKFALLLICTDEFRAASLRSWGRFFPTLMQHQHQPATTGSTASEPLLPDASISHRLNGIARNDVCDWSVQSKVMVDLIVRCLLRAFCS